MIFSHTTVKMEPVITDSVTEAVDTLTIGDLVPAVSGPSMPSRR